MSDPLARGDWIGTREDRWTDVLPQSWQSAINTNPVVNALARYMAPRPSFDQATRDWQDSLPGNSPIDRIADGRSSLAREYPKPMSPFATEALDKAGFLANFIAPGGVKLPTPSAPKPQGIRAYHGSPHDFDRFDISKIGTGEGAQAYGRGLYFAEAEDVAKSYKLPQRHVDAGNVYEVFPTEADALKAAGPGGGAMTYRDGWVAEKASGGVIKKNNGNMYEVRINADPERFLDWDKPLHAQNPAIRTALESAIGEKANDPLFRRMFLDQGKAQDAYGAAVNVTGGPDKAMTALRDAGIPGIRYKDAMSRDGGGPGTSNYVVFDDKMIEILRKYGLLPPLAAGAAQVTTQGQDQQF